MLDRYADAIEAVHNAATTYRQAVETLTDAEEELERKTAYTFQENVNAAAYVAAGSNETTRKERRTIWLDQHLGPQQEAVRTAKLAKLDAEYAYDYAKRLCRLEELRVRYLGGDDLLSDEPKNLPADPRRDAAYRDASGKVHERNAEGWQPLDTDTLERVDR